MSTKQLEQTDPRNETRQRLTEHFNITHGSPKNEIEIDSVTLNHDGSTLDAEFACPDCSFSITETYLLRYAERLSDNTRFGRNESPKCDCEQSTTEGEHFSEIRRYKVDENTAVATSECNWCGDTFEDVFKIQHYSRS
jgi:hypothetical protein